MTTAKYRIVQRFDKYHIERLCGEVNMPFMYIPDGWATISRYDLLCDAEDGLQDIIRYSALPKEHVIKTVEVPVNE